MYQLHVLGAKKLNLADILPRIRGYRLDNTLKLSLKAQHGIPAEQRAVVLETP
jgi:hypothetical protein